MEHDHMNLEHQTAPESTRGLFDPPYQEASPPVNHPTVPRADKRRSFHAYGSATVAEANNHPAIQKDAFGRGHQRSRSAVMLTNQNANRNFGLQTLTEEGGDGQSAEAPLMTVDSLQDMINTLKSLPPVTLKESGPSSNRNSASSLAMPRKHRSVSLSMNGYGPDAMQNMVQSAVQELRNIPNDKNARRRSRRASSMNSSFEASAAFRDAALAEAEAKLTGTLSKIENLDNVPRRTMPRRHSTSQRLSSTSFGHEERGPGRRRYSESSSGFDLNSLNLNGKRLSLQQLPALAENTEESDTVKAGRRLTFNKPLVLEDSNKKIGQSRRSSRNLDYDWRASTAPVLPPYSPHSSAQQSFSLVPFTPTRVSFAKDDANPHQRRPLFIAHLPFSALPPLFRARQLVRGILRVNKRNRSDAYVSCEDLDDDVYVCGSRDRNRALEGDVVAVRLVDVDKVLREKKEKEEAKLARNGGQPRVRMPDEEDENEIIFGGDDDVDTVKPKYCGVVVAVLERAQNQVFSGTLTLMRPNNKRAEEEKAAEEARKAEGKDVPIRKEAPRIVWFKATDKRVPLIAIPIEQAPADFVDNNENYANRLFVGSIKRWPITSLHPFGSLERELGVVTDMDVQTMAILADNNVTSTDFSEAVKLCLPPIPSELPNTADRRDYTDTRIFTIDPAGSKILDDAFSIKKLGDDTYEVGVHVSDVSYYIKPHSPLDKEARARAASVSLVHKFVPMLPEDLTEKVTNLDPGVTRLAISVVWTMSSQGKILDTWVGRTIVKSCAQLTYEDAQKVLDKQSLNHIADESLRVGIEKDIEMLFTIANNRRQERLSEGDSMTLKRDELEHTFDPAQPVAPISVTIKTTNAATLTVKELHLMANQTVAQRISSKLPDHALLRRQAPPTGRKIRELKEYAAHHLGVDLDISSPGNIQHSIDAIQDPTLRKLVTVLVLKTLHPPKYFCAGTFDILKYSHYALNMPLFTHFTAPSRRYADIIVHRQLEAALNGEEDFYLDRDTIQKLAHHCNVKKEAARNARDQSSLLFLATHFCAKQQPFSHNIAVFRDAIVVAVFDQFFDVMIPELNLEKRVHLAHLPVWRSEYDGTQRTLTMYWKKNVATSTGNGQQEWHFLDEEEEVDEDALVAEMEEEEEEEKRSQLPVNGKVSSETEKGRSIEQKTEDVAASSMPPSMPSERPAGRRASVLRARLSDSMAYSIEQGSQTIKALDRIKVVVIVDMIKPPPVVRILAANPFA